MPTKQSKLSALHLLRKSGQFPEYLNIWGEDGPNIWEYEGNYKAVECVPSRVVLQPDSAVYILDYSDYEGGTAFISIDSSGFGFTQSKPGASIKLIILTPPLQASIPMFSFAGITFADFEEIDMWEPNKTYILNLITDNGGTRWIVSDTEVY